MRCRFQKQIDFLLGNACPSIRYLVHRDILKTPVGEPFMRELQKDILAQPNVAKHLAAQHDDGWFGVELHGSDAMDHHISKLLGVGVERDNPALTRAARALTTPGLAGNHKNWFRGGEALDSDGRGGNRAVVASILASVGANEATPALRGEIALSFEHLSAVMDYASVDDFSIRTKNCRYYKPKVRFPGANHINLLAATQSWRTEERLRLAGDAVRHAYGIMRDVDEFITFRKPAGYGSGFVGPFNYNWQALSPIDAAGLEAIVNDPYAYRFGFWLRTVSTVPDWAWQSAVTYELLADMLEQDAIFGMLPDKTLNAFRRICGREPDWRRKNAAECDVTYAVLRSCYDVVS